MVAAPALAFVSTSSRKESQPSTPQHCSFLELGLPDGRPSTRSLSAQLAPNSLRNSNSALLASTASLLRETVSSSSNKLIPPDKQPQPGHLRASASFIPSYALSPMPSRPASTSITVLGPTCTRLAIPRNEFPDHPCSPSLGHSIRPRATTAPAITTSLYYEPLGTDLGISLPAPDVNDTPQSPHEEIPVHGTSPPHEGSSASIPTRPKNVIKLPVRRRRPVSSWEKRWAPLCKAGPLTGTL